MKLSLWDTNGLWTFPTIVILHTIYEDSVQWNQIYASDELGSEIIQRNFFLIE